MLYTRLYPILNTTSYRPSDNPIRKQINVTVTDGSGYITGVRADYVTTIIDDVSKWYVNITSGTNNNLVGSYRVNDGGADELLLMDMALGSALLFNPPAGSTGSDYTIEFYENYRPTEKDGFAEAFVLNTIPSSQFKIITRAGQYMEIEETSLVAGAVYSIAIAEILDNNGAEGFLLGAEGINGSGLIP